MKSLQSKIPKTIKLKTNLVCADNTGAKQLQVIAVHSYSGTLRKLPSAGLGDVVVCTVKKEKKK